MRPETIEFPDGMPVRAYIRDIGQYPYHWHDALEIVYVLQGSIHISLGYQDHLLKRNDMAVINMDEIHRISASGPENRVLSVQIDSGFFRSILPDKRYFFIYCCSTYHEGEPPEKYVTLKGHIARLVWTLNEKRKDQKKDIERALTAMVMHLTENFDFLRWGPGTEAFDGRQVERIKQMAEATTADPFDTPGLKELAEAAGVSLHHLSHDIKAKFGLTFQELLFYGRIEQAAKLLLGTDERILDIALECGFSDPKYLIKHFKRFYRYTPSQFRKMHRADDKTLASQVRYRDYPLSEATGYLDP